MTAPSAIRKLTAWASDASARLRKMGKPVWRVLTLSPGDDAVSRKRAIGISIEKSCVSIVDGERFLSRIRIRAMRRYPLEEGRVATPESVANTVSLAVREFRAKNAEICLDIPKAWAIVQFAELPATVKETLSDVVSFELDRLTPFSSDLAFYDFRIIEENPEKLRIAVAAVRSDLVQPYVTALREKGIRVDAVRVSMTCMAALLGHAGQGADAVFLDIDEHGYEAALIRNGDLSSALAERLEGDGDESIISRAMQEIAPFIDQLRTEGKPHRIIFHLRGRLADRGHPVLEKLVTAPCRVLDDIDLKVEIPGRRDGIPYSALGGVLASLRPNAAGMNLLTKGRRRDAVRPMVVTAILGLVVLCAAIFFMISPIAIEGKRLEELDRQISLRKAEAWKIEAVRKEIDGVSREIAAINDLKAGRPMTMDIIKELTAILPKSAWIARMRITDTGVDIEGYASGSAAELLPVLERSAYLQKVEFSSPTVRDPRMNADRFVIKMELERKQ